MPSSTTTAPHELPIVALSGAAAGAIAVDKEFLTAPVNTALLHQLVQAQRASLRAGTASTKRRGEVSGGGKKPWKQKHTGRARAGSIRSPLWRHGGITFGPHPRDFGYRLPLQMRRAGLREALRAKAREGELTIVSELAATQISTKAFAATKLFQDLAQSTLVVLERLEPMIVRSLRNLRGVTLTSASDVTAYDLVNHRRVLVTTAAWAMLDARSREHHDA